MTAVRMLWIFALAILFSNSARADPKAPELNPYLKLLKKSAPLQTARTPQVQGLGPVFTRQSNPPPVPVLVETRDPARTSLAAKKAGATVGRPIGHILPVRIPVTRLEAILDQLAQMPEVGKIEGSPPRQTHLDISRPEVGADRVELGEGLPMPVDGRGVIAALLDTGLDYKHADFSGGRGRTRVMAIWDQAFGSGNPPPGQTIGSYCDRDSLLAKTCNSIDIISHGTHVAATMAGSGDIYRGMAPKADLMGVASIDFALMVDSVDWLFQQADLADQPMVVNMSLGGHYGPHDGTSLESQALSALTGPGRIIVASAGNEGSDLIHLGYDPQGDTGKTLFHVFTGFDVSVGLFTMWLAPQADLSFAVGVQKDGLEVSQTDFMPFDEGYFSFNLSDNGTPLGRVQLESAGAADQHNGKFQVDLLVEPTNHSAYGNPDEYVWYLKVQGTGSFDAWSAASGLATPPARFSQADEDGLIPGDNRKSVGMPSVALGVISIGSYATRGSWVDYEGKQVSHDETTENDISFFSSNGPSADPDRTGQKPWIAGPGEYIIAAMSSSSGPLEEGTKIDDTHLAMRGTSMSGPHLAGIVALLLQVDPTLDPDGVRRILALSARQDEFTGEVPNDIWGYGKADAFSAVATALGVGNCEEDNDCTDGWTCGSKDLCKKKAGGCGCQSEEASPTLPLLGLLALLSLLIRRK